jgi:hypothetical protein
MAATTLRMPDELREQLADWAQEEGRSFNELAIEILRREVKRREALRTLDRARSLRERLRTRYGVLPDSTPLIREMREERSVRG